MGWPRLGRDPAAERSKDAAYTRKIEKMRGTSKKVNRGRAVPKAAAPHPCGRACGYLSDGGGCPSTVRGGHCPCRHC